jgi:hypothetical protein
MVTINVWMHDNTKYTVDVESYDANALTLKLNDHSILMVAIGDLVINKNSIKMIAPDSTASTTA